MKPIKYLPLSLLLAILLLVSGCSEDELYGVKSTAYVNFFQASEVIMQAGLTTDNFIYINDSVPNGPIKRFFPQIEPFISDTRQFPSEISDGGDGYTPGVIHGVGGRYSYIYYMGLDPDSYRFIFTGENKVFLKDTLVNLSADSYTDLYLTEDRGDQDYRIVAVPNQHTAIAGKVQVRIVHLSADTEPLTVSRAYDNGKVDTGLGYPTQLAFGQYSDYVPFDTEDTDAELNNIMLRFSPAGDPDNILLTASIPVDAGASYTVLVRGLRNSATRRIHTGYNSDGARIYSEHAVNANLRTTLRRNL